MYLQKRISYGYRKVINMIFAVRSDFYYCNRHSVCQYDELCQ